MATDNVIYVNTNTNSVTLTLPAPSNGRVFEIKDSTGNASSKHITISPHSTETIDGQSSLVVSTNYGYVRLISDGTNWFSSQNASGQNYITALTGDVVATGPGSATATIQSNVVSNSKLAQMPANTLKGNNTGSTANAADLTVSQVNTLLGTLLANGSVALTANWNAGSFQITANGVQVGAGANTISQVSILNASGQMLLETGGGTVALTLSLSQQATFAGPVGVGAFQSFAGVTVQPSTMTTTLTTTNQEGFTVEGAFNTSATNSVTSFNANATTSAAAYTLTTLEQFVANNPTKGSGSTITRTINYRSVNPTSGSTGNADFADNVGFSGSYFIHSTSTNPSRLSGYVGIGGAEANNAVLSLGQSNPLAGTNQQAIYVNMTATSAATNGFIGAYINLFTAAAAFTVDHAIGVDVENIGKGSGSTITRAIGITLATQTNGANNASIADNQAFTGNYFINQSGTNPSTFGGKIGVSGAEGSNALIKVGSGSGNVLTGSTQYGVESSLTFTSAATTLGCAFIGDATTAAASFTLPLLAQFYAQNVARGSGSTVTRQVMYYAEDPSTGSNSAILADNSAFSGNFVFNITSTNSSTLAGNLGVGGAQSSNAVIQAGASNPLSGSNQTAFEANLVGTSAATSQISGFRADVSSAAASFTCANAIGINVQAITAGSASTITRATAGLFVNPSAGSGTISNQAILADNVSYTGSWGLNLSTTNYNYLAGGLRIGTTTAINSTTEFVSVEYDNTAAATLDTTAMTVRQVISGNTGITSGQPGAATFRMRRSITANTTDSYGNVTPGASFLYDINPGTGATYTVANSGSSAIATVVCYIPNNIGAGTSAINFATGLYVRNGGGATGTRSAGIFMDGVSSGTNNAYIATNNTYTGNYFIYDTTGNQSVLSGAVTLGTAGSSLTHTIKGNTLNYAGDSSNTSMQFTMDNSAGANTTNTIMALIGPSGQTTGQNLISFRRSSDSSNAWSMGQNNNVNHQFEICQASSALGTNQYMVINTAGAFILGSSSFLSLNWNTINGAQEFKATSGSANIFNADQFDYTVNLYRDSSGTMRARASTTGYVWYTDGRPTTATAIACEWDINYQDAQTANSAAVTTNNITALRITGAGSILQGKNALSTSATDGFFYIRTMAGAPSGTPSAFSGLDAMVYDTTNHKLWVFDTGSSTWKGVVLT